MSKTYKLETTRIQNDATRTNCTVKTVEKNELVLSFTLGPDPYCCGLLQMGNIGSSVYDPNRRKAALEFLKDVINNELFKFELGGRFYDNEAAIACTLVDRNLIHLFVEAGFYTVKSFTNYKTQNVISLLVAELYLDYVREDDDDEYDGDYDDDDEF